MEALLGNISIANGTKLTGEKVEKDVANDSTLKDKAKCAQEDHCLFDKDDLYDTLIDPKPKTRQKLIDFE